VEACPTRALKYKTLDDLTKEKRLDTLKEFLIIYKDKGARG